MGVSQSVNRFLANLCDLGMLAFTEATLLLDKIVVHMVEDVSLLLGVWLISNLIVHRHTGDASLTILIYFENILTVLRVLVC